MRFFAFTGKRKSTWINQPPDRHPYLVFMGPSGNLTQVYPPSGYTSKYPTQSDIMNLQQCECTQNQRPLGWMRGWLTTWFSRTYNTSISETPFAWCRKHQLAPKINPSTPSLQPELNIGINDLVIEDGHHWRLWQYVTGIRNTYVFYRVHDALLCQQHPCIGGSSPIIIKQGLFTGKDPYRFTSTSWWICVGGTLGGYAADIACYWWPTNNLHPLQEGVYYPYAGQDNLPSNMSLGMCDMVEHNGSFYSCDQFGVYMQTGLEGRGTILHHIYATDNSSSLSYHLRAPYAGYISRKKNPNLNPSLDVLLDIVINFTC